MKESEKLFKGKYVIVESNVGEVWELAMTCLVVCCQLAFIKVILSILYHIWEKI